MCSRSHWLSLTSGVQKAMATTSLKDTPRPARAKRGESSRAQCELRALIFRVQGFAWRGHLPHHAGPRSWPSTLLPGVRLTHYIGTRMAAAAIYDAFHCPGVHHVLAMHSTGTLPSDADELLRREAVLILLCQDSVKLEDWLALSTVGGPGLLSRQR
jgi:hypothetical protein